MASLFIYNNNINNEDNPKNSLPLHTNKKIISSTNNIEKQASLNKNNPTYNLSTHYNNKHVGPKRVILQNIKGGKQKRSLL